MRRAIVAATLLALAACAHAPPAPPSQAPAPAPPPSESTSPAPPPAAEPSPPHEQVGMASFYGRRFQGHRTASGERYDTSRLTCAHRTEPFGTRLRVTELESGRSVVVRVNDRGPFARGRVVDLSLAAARELGIVHRGLARVRVERID